MSGIHFILIATGLIGMLPLCIVLYKQKRTRTIIETGVPAKARIYRINSTPKYGDTVLYCFYNMERQPAYGSLHSKAGLYNVNDVIDIYFLPGNPKRNTVEGAWKSPAFVIFTVLIALFCWFAVYKLFEMVNAGAL